MVVELSMLLIVHVFLTWDASRGAFSYFPESASYLGRVGVKVPRPEWMKDAI